MLDISMVVQGLVDAGLIDEKEFDKKVEEYKQDAPALKLAQDNASLLMLLAEKDLQLAKTNQQLLETNNQQATLLMALVTKGVL